MGAPSKSRSGDGGVMWKPPSGAGRVVQTMREVESRQSPAKLCKIELVRNKFLSFTYTNFKSLINVPVLNNEEKLKTIHGNGLIYTDKELNSTLDMSKVINNNNTK
ncbi:hypothetical protein Zmor_019023 [Zophobas morio]|uniref:Uncharacterized protein n=1 Tax=Zophobas morio TaxID=2755281 RepID=A0AA38ME94_9CUCU|nr:hypothetical protein Zmor_019023 [Zophobas morio]